VRSLQTIILLLFAISLFGQSDSTSVADSARAARKRIYSAPRRASILSAVLPGAGQVYNRKYWKVPLIYGALGGLGYMFYVNNDNYNYYRRNLAALSDKDESTENVTPYDSNGLIELKQTYRRYRDFAGFGIILVYLINIVDANVDAHLKTFDVSDDLSLHLEPHPVWGGAGRPTAGIKLTLKFN
jgi:hypothetical protein